MNNGMSRRTFLKGVAGSAAAFGATAALRPDPPDVVFVIVDDMRPVLACYGDPIAFTPNIDRLAARGIRFTRAYCQAPLCGPSRSSLFTSLYPETLGILDNTFVSLAEAAGGRPTMPRWFREHGYRTIEIGKVLHPGNPDPDAWDVAQPPEQRPDGAPDRQTDPAGWVSWYSQASKRYGPVEGSARQARDRGPARRAAAALAERGDRPRFVGVGLRGTHAPLLAPAAYFDHYPLQSVGLPPSFLRDVSTWEDRPRLLRANWEVFGQSCPSEEAAREAIRAYYACVSEVDDMLGVALDGLDRSGLRERTIVVLTSDHGFHLGERGLWSKQTPYEAAARVPLIIAGPGVAPGVVEEPVELMDVYPTLCEMCGLQVPEHCQGRSLASVLRGAEAARPKPAYTVVGTPAGEVAAWTVRNARYRYVEWADGTRELYDYAADAGETRNVLVDDPALPPPARDLPQVLEGFRARARPTGGGSRRSAPARPGAH